MRLTKEELLSGVPSWNEGSHDIVRVSYGDDPLIIWDEKEYEKWKQLTGTESSIQAVDAYIYAVNGSYRIYRTLIGDVYIHENGDVLCGSIRITNNNHIVMNRMYCHDSLDILHITASGVIGFSNLDGQGSPNMKTSEMRTDMIERILNYNLSDYGESIQKFMINAKEIYESDQENYILTKIIGKRG